MLYRHSTTIYPFMWRVRPVVKIWNNWFHVYWKTTVHWKWGRIMNLLSESNVYLHGKNTKVYVEFGMYNSAYRRNIKLMCHILKQFWLSVTYSTLPNGYFNKIKHVYYIICIRFITFIFMPCRHRIRRSAFAVTTWERLDSNIDQSTGISRINHIGRVGGIFFRDSTSHPILKLVWNNE